MKTKFKHDPANPGRPSEITILRGGNLETFARPEALVPAEPSEANIRERAYILYEEGDRLDGHDIEHWVEATAQLKAKALGSWSPTRHRIHS